MKKMSCLLIAVLSFFYCITASAISCSNKGSIVEAVYNLTGEKLVASYFMNMQIYDASSDYTSNLGTDNKFRTTSGNVSFQNEAGIPGNIRVESCAGGGGSDRIQNSNRWYDWGMSVGPYIFISHQGSYPYWQTGLDGYFAKNLLATLQWTADTKRDIYWNIYTQNNAHYTQILLPWGSRNECRNDAYKKYSVCWAVELRNCTDEYMAGWDSRKGKGSCDTYADYYIRNLGTTNSVPLPGPIGK